MKTFKISDRLRRVANYVPAGSVVADIGSDHAYLPAFLVTNGNVKHAVAGELNHGPFEAAKRHVKEMQLEQSVTVRKGNGLEVLSQNEVDAVTIAGMGGGTICEILKRGFDRLLGVKRLILQPMVDSERLRRWLHEHEWKIVAEDLVWEDDLLYEIIVAEPGSESYSDPFFYESGDPHLLAGHPLISRKADLEMDRIDRALRGLEKSKSLAAESKKEALLTRRSRWEEWKRS